MIPFIYFILAWFILLGIFLILAGLSIFQMLRYGLSHPITHLSTAIFVFLIIVVVIGTLGYLSGLDPKTTIDTGSLFILPNESTI